MVRTEIEPAAPSRAGGRADPPALGEVRPRREAPRIGAAGGARPEAARGFDIAPLPFFAAFTARDARAAARWRERALAPAQLEAADKSLAGAPPALRKRRRGRSTAGGRGQAAPAPEEGRP